MTCLDLQLASKLALSRSPPVITSSLQSITGTDFCFFTPCSNRKVMPAELRTYHLRYTTDHGFVELPHAAALVAVKAQRRNAARRIRGARSAGAIDVGGLPARVAPPRWRNINAVVDNDARARRTQARLNLALERGTSTWHAVS